MLNWTEIQTENMILSLHASFCFKFIIVLRTLLFSAETCMI